MEGGDFESDSVGVGLFADVERVAPGAVDELEPLVDVLQPDAFLAVLVVRCVAAVDDGAGDLVVGIFDREVDERAPVVAHAVLEGVFDEDDQQQRRNRDPRRTLARIVDADVHGIGVADAHELDVVHQELHVVFKRDALAARIVEHVAHHLR